MQELLNCVNESEFDAVGQGISDVISVLEQTNTKFQLPRLTNHQQLLFAQLSFDWLNKVNEKLNFLCFFSYFFFA